MAGILWESAGWIFASIVVNSTQYTAIYSSFAVLMFFMIWLYLSWLILLVGASVAFYTQNPHYLGLTNDDFHFSARLRERVALQSVFLIARDYFLDRPGWTVQRLASRFDLPAEPLADICEALTHERILAPTSEAQTLLPARDMASVRVKEVLDIVRSAEEQSHLQLSRIQTEPCVQAVMDNLESAWTEALGAMTVKDFALSGEDKIIHLKSPDTAT